MCGIAGAIGFVDAEVSDAVRRASAAQAHRGPDGQGHWERRGAEGGPGLVLGHRRLAILDLDPRASQPMRDEKSGCVLVYNGEIYGFRALRDELEELGHEFRTTSDTEVLLLAWSEWGEACLQRLRGMFAFAMWDPRAGRLTLVRDRLGIKPLYLAEVRRPGGGRVLLFGSELRSLLAGGLVEPRLDPATVASYVWNGFVPSQQAIVRDVRLLPAGHAVGVDLHGRASAPRRWWSLPSAFRHRSRREDVQRELESTVEAHLVSDVPLGVFLSGGVDSTAVAALAARSRSSDLKTFNVRMEDSAWDESPYARAVAQAIGSDHSEIVLTCFGFQRQLDQAIACLDQPSFDAINTWVVSRAVRDAGIAVALAGTGGDEVFGGYRSFVDLPRARRIANGLSALPRGARRTIGHLGVRLAYGARRGMAPQTRWGKLTDVLDAGRGLVQQYQTAYALFTRELHGLLLEFPVSELPPYGLPSERLEELEREVAGEPELHAISLLELESYLGQRLLRDTDCASMAVSLEVRVPLLDHQLLECVTGLPDDQRFLPLGRKELLRSVAPRELDPSVLERPKSGFVLPIEAWCRDLLREEVAGVLHDAEACRAAGLAPNTVEALWAAFDGRLPGHYWSRVWSLYVLLRWCRIHRATL